MSDPTVTDGDHYSVIFENDRVRVLEYRDQPGTRTQEHHHPDSVMVSLTPIHRRITSGDRTIEVEPPAEAARWLPAQDHVGENIGQAPIHAIFVELKEPSSTPSGTGRGLGPFD